MDIYLLTQKRNKYIFMMVIAIILIIYSLSIAISLGLPKGVMDNYSTDMSNISSVSGNSVAEVYYRDFGGYLSGLSSYFNRITLPICAAAIIGFGVLFVYAYFSYKLVRKQLNFLKNAIDLPTNALNQSGRKIEDETKK